MEELTGLHSQPLPDLYLHSTMDLIMEGLVPLWVTAVSHCPCLRGARRSCGKPQLDIAVGFGHCRGVGERTLIAEKVSWRRLGLETKEQGDGRLPAWGRFGSFGVPGSTLARYTSHSTDKKSCSSSHSSKGHRSLSNSLKLPDSGSKILCPV